MVTKALLLALISLSCCSIAFAYDYAGPLLQDVCVAELKNPVGASGYGCKDMKLVTAEDFYMSWFEIAGNTSNPFGSNVKRLSMTELPGMNRLGITMARADFAPWAVNPPHIHPRAGEILTVVRGTIEVGFIEMSPEVKLIKRVLKKGDVFVIPKGLVHFERNVGHGNAVFIAAFGSENPGVIMVGNELFGSEPSISAEVLAKASHVDENLIFHLQSNF